MMRKVFSVFALVAMICGCSSSYRSRSPEISETYVVNKGDTLAEIARRFNVPTSDLQDFNEIENPRSLRIGSLLVIPVSTSADFGRASLGLNPRAPDTSSEGKLISLAPVRHFIGRLQIPVKQAVISSQFGTRSGTFHEGLDLSVPSGTRVYAAHDGRVVFERDSFGRYGKVIVIKSGALLTLYAHNRKNRVSYGDDVEKGDWIAEVGETGDATGPHLHFETRVRNGKGKYAAVDPRNFLR